MKISMMTCSKMLCKLWAKYDHHQAYIYKLYFYYLTRYIINLSLFNCLISHLRGILHYIGLFRFTYYCLWLCLFCLLLGRIVLFFDYYRYNNCFICLLEDNSLQHLLVLIKYFLFLAVSSHQTISQLSDQLISFINLPFKKIDLLILFSKYLS